MSEKNINLTCVRCGQGFERPLGYLSWVLSRRRAGVHYSCLCFSCDDLASNLRAPAWPEWDLERLVRNYEELGEEKTGQVKYQLTACLELPTITRVTITRVDPLLHRFYGVDSGGKEHFASAEWFFDTFEQARAYDHYNTYREIKRLSDKISNLYRRFHYTEKLEDPAAEEAGEEK